MPTATAAAVATMNGEMFLAIRCCKAQWHPDGAEAFAATLRDVLLGA